MIRDHDDINDFLGNPIDAMGKLESLSRLWILRVLVRLGCVRKFVRNRDFYDDDLAGALGFGRLVDRDDSKEFDRKSIVEKLRVQLTRLESRKRRPNPPPVLARNIGRLAKLLELTPEECRVLEFAILIHGDERLDNACELLGRSFVTTKAIRALAKILDLPAKRVAEALHPKGQLALSGILTTRRHGGSCDLRGILDPLSGSFVDLMLSADTNPTDLLRGTVALAPPPALEPSDYSHLSESMDLLRAYLHNSLAVRRRGVNVFLYGPPGTGKTQLARLLARELKSELFEISSEDDDGDPVDGERRLRAYRAAQTLLSKRRSLIVFDEVEDVFNDGSELFGRKSTAQTRKAWMNRMLEEAPVATFWLSNSIHNVDPAFIRRFDMVIEVPIPPRSQRQRIVERACGDLVGAACVARIAESDKVAPAVVARATSIIRSLGQNNDASKAERALEHLIDNTLEAQGCPRLSRNDPSRLPDTYSLAFLNPDTDIGKIAKGLSESRTGRLCLYGPPGTGKSAFGRWLARQLGQPLMIKRASDILSPYLGMTEKKLAAAFREASQDGAVLMIDEIDSFLRDRSEAQRPWEVTQVNEMLTQMEAFPGIFIASTNLMDGLDKAALRRFDAKVRLNYLNADQAVAMLRSECQSLGLQPPTAVEEAAIRRLGNLAPGDFAALVRQNRFRSIDSALQFVRYLEAESALKGGKRNPIGFVH